MNTGNETHRLNGSQQHINVDNTPIMDSTPGLEVYESYETDYKTLAASIADKLKGEARESKGGESIEGCPQAWKAREHTDPFLYTHTEARKGVLRRIEMELEEADEIVRLPCHLAAL